MASVNVKHEDPVAAILEVVADAGRGDVQEFLFVLEVARNSAVPQSK
jgi:hypothetical protein